MNRTPKKELDFELSMVNENIQTMNTLLQSHLHTKEAKDTIAKQQAAYQELEKYAQQVSFEKRHLNQENEKLLAKLEALERKLEHLTVLQEKFEMIQNQGEQEAIQCRSVLNDPVDSSLKGLFDSISRLIQLWQFIVSDNQEPVYPSFSSLFNALTELQEEKRGIQQFCQWLFTFLKDTEPLDIQQLPLSTALRMCTHRVSF
jgi:chromosome segregation ATPase